MERPPKNEYYMNIAKSVSLRSNCLSAHYGAIIVKDDQIIASGYNGAPRKTRDCMQKGSCLRRELNIKSGHRYELCRSVHAEQNAIINAARAGVSLLGGTLYLYGVKSNGLKEPEIVDAVPCFICKKMIINAGISKLISIMKDGSIKEFNVSDWVEDWSKNDMIDDVVKYSVKY